MRAFGLVVVLFEPDANALANLDHAQANCPVVVVVDNSPTPDPELHRSLRHKGFMVVVNTNAGGLAGAYNRGVAALKAQGRDLYFLLDQDSDVEEGYFDRMASASERIAEDAFIIGPLVYETRLDRYFPDLAPGTVDDQLHRTDIVISSGSGVSAAAYQLLGPFREDLFIEYIDTEYSLRAARAGVPLFVDTSEVLRQQTGAITTHGRRFTTNHVALRRYYLTRNIIGVGRSYGRLLPAIVGGSRITARELGTVLLYERDKVRKVVAILVGVLDGFRVRLGRFEDNHPRVHRWCVKPGFTPTSPRMPAR